MRRYGPSADGILGVGVAYTFLLVIVGGVAELAARAKASVTDETLTTYPYAHVAAACIGALAIVTFIVTGVLYMRTD
jgi:hypothetical protein